MKYLSIILILLLFGCETNRKNGYNSTSDNLTHKKVEVTHTIEIVKLKDSIYNPGIAIRTRIKNKTGKDIFLYRPQTQAWYDYNGKTVQYGSENPIGRTLGVIPHDYQPWNDTINNPAFDLANEMLEKMSEPPNRQDLQRLIFTANVFFLKDGQEKEMIDDITYIHFNSPVTCKIVTSYLQPVLDGNKILDTPPSFYRGYEFWTEPILSDTTFFKIR